MLQAKIKKTVPPFPLRYTFDGSIAITAIHGGTEPYKKRFCLTRCPTPRRQHGHYSHTRGYKTAVLCHMRA